jgi:glucose-6-phosphate 1-dehydrogenase
MKRWRRRVMEKPFGHDLSTAKALNARLLKVFAADVDGRAWQAIGNRS